MSKSSTKKNVDASVMSIAVIGSIILLNLIAAATYLGRVDMTHDGQYTLAEATEDTLRRLHDPVTIRAYFSSDMPPQLASNAGYVQDLLEEYAAKGGSYVRYEFIDPQASETEEDKEKKKEVKQDIFGRQFREQTDIEKELEGLGIPAVNVKVMGDGKVEQRRVYMGIAVHYGSESEVIPVVQDTSSLEYDLTSLVRKVTRDSTPKLAFVVGDGSPDPQEALGQLFGLLGQNYDVSTVDMMVEAKLADDVQAIIVLGPKTPFSEDAKKALDAFVVSGRSAAFLLDTVKLEFKTLTAEDFDHGLTDMLANWGVNIEPGVVMDVECDTIGVARRVGPIVIPEPVKYHYMPLVRTLNRDHMLTRGLADVVFPFMSPLRVTVPEGSDVKAEVLVSSSDNAWVETPPYKLDPSHRWTKAEAGALEARGLIVTLTGALKSSYGAAAPDAPVDEAVDAAPASGSGRVFVAGGTGFINAELIRQRQSNMALMLNLSDWLLSDDALLAMRARGLTAAPLDEIKDGTRSTIKFMNIVGLPLAFIGFGVIRWRMRESRRARVTV